MVHALDLVLVENVEHFSHGQNDLLRVALEGDDSVRALRSAGLIHFDVGAGRFPDLLNFVAGFTDNPADEALMD